MARFMQTFPTVVRVRPSLPGEAAVQMQTTQREVKVLDDTHFFTQSVPTVLPATSSQEDAFRCVSPYISRVGKGYHAAVIAYGETGSGKTFTLFGNGDGVVPRAVTELYKNLSPHINRGRHYVILISSVLIHQEKVYDLLEPNPLDNELIIRETEVGISVEGLSEEMAMSLSTCTEVIRRVHSGRLLLDKVLPPSKSHVILHLKVESQKVCRHGALRKMKLTFCDMAGSEGQGKGPDSLHRSLDTFHLVLGAIGNTGAHVPYRESKLTILLQHALHPACNTCFIYTISPAVRSIEPTIETLKRAGKTASIPFAPEKIKIKINTELTEALRYEVDFLRESMQQFNPAVELPAQVGKKQATTEVEEVEELLQTILDYKTKQKGSGSASIDRCDSIEKKEEQQSIGLTVSRKKSEAKGAVSLGETESVRQQPAFLTPVARAHSRASASPVYSRAEERTTRHAHNSLDLSFDQVVMQPSRTRNERRERNQASFRQAVEQSRRLNPVQSDFARGEPSEEVKGLIQAQIRKFEEEREANRRRLEQKIKKERDEQDAFRRKLERRPMIEPRPLRPRQAVDRFKRLLE